MAFTRQEIEAAHAFVTQERNRNARLETFSQRLPPTYERLLEAARDGEQVNYGELAAHANTNPRHYMSKILDGIGYIQMQRKEPPLDVLAVQSGNGRPADGFFELLEDLDRRAEYESTADDGLVGEITEQVHTYYG